MKNHLLILLTVIHFSGLLGLRLPAAEVPAVLTPRAVVKLGGLYEIEERHAHSPEFHAIKSVAWPNGLVPLFGYEVRGKYRLSRKPKTGWENLMEPIFFAVPGETEIIASKITGAWSVSATHIDGHTDEFFWELTTHSNNVAGRFDLHTDYRFATISGGTWSTTQLAIKVDYINEHFELTAQLTDDEVSGPWRRTDDGDGGVWKATRLRPDPMIQTNGFAMKPLFEWTNRQTKERVYTTGKMSNKEFTRTEPALCRVWVKKD